MTSNGRRRSHRAHSKTEIKTAKKLIDQQVETLWKYNTISTIRGDTSAACYLSPDRLQLIIDSTLEEFKKRDINLKGIKSCFEDYFESYADEQLESDWENGI